jgi:hypothetical protein
MDKTEDKLQEANFFYNKMRESIDFPLVFCNYLSAFLSASRSVLQYILGEIQKKKKVNEKQWYDDTMSQSPVLTFFKDKRDVNIHKNPIEVKKGIGIALQETISISEAISVEITDNKGNVKNKYFSESQPQNSALKDKPVIKIVYGFNDWPGEENVLILCKKYLDELNQVVREGKARGFIS